MSGNYNNIDYQALLIKSGTNAEPLSITYYGEARNAITAITVAGTPETVTWTDAIDLNQHPVGSTFNVYIDGVTFDGDDPNGAQVVTVATATTGTIPVDLAGDTIGVVAAFWYAEDCIVRDVVIDSYASGDPVYLGTTLLNHRFNIAEGRFERIDVEEINPVSGAVTSKFELIAYSDQMNTTGFTWLNPTGTPFDFDIAAADTVDGLSTDTTEDSTAGHGIDEYEITGLATLASTAETTETVAGAAGVFTGASTFARVNDIRATALGSTATTDGRNNGLFSNAGTIAFIFNTTEYVGDMPINEGRLVSGMKTVPTSSTWCISSINIWSEEKRSFEVRIMGKDNTSVVSAPYLIHRAIISNGNESIICGSDTTINIAAATDVYVIAQQRSGQSGGEIGVHIIGALVAA